MLDLNKVYYFGHPCTTGGLTIEQNKLHEERAYKRLVEEYPGIKVVRPLKIIPDNMLHGEAMVRCFKFLSGCDAAIFSGHWLISKGCMMEVKYCLDNDKGVIEYENLFNN